VVLLAMQNQPSETRLVLKHPLWKLGKATLGSRPVQGAPRVPSYLPLANQVARELAEELDAIPQSALNEVILDIPTTAHILGGCVPGDGPEEGVVDGNLEVFGYPGLYVMDGSVVGANLGVNPSLTIASLAEYAVSLWSTRRT
jgi:cholesterol oxidase